MAKYTPDTVSSGFNTASKINENFTDIATELNDKVLYRDNPVGEPNSMSNDLDMNSNDVLNVNSIDAVDIVVGGTSIADQVTAASDSAAAALVSENNASTSETNAGVSESNASASAAAAAASASAGLYKNVVDIAFVDSPYTPTELQDGNLFQANTSGGAITVTLPDSTGISTDIRVAVSKMTADANAVTVQRSGTDTINGGTSFNLTAQYEVVNFILDQSSGEWLMSGGVVGGITATNVSYSNGTSGLTATDAQAALDEVEGRVDTAESDITTLEGNRLLKSNNLSDLVSAATAFANIKQAASTTATGVVERATQAEVDAGTDTTRYITPATLAATTVVGSTQASAATNGWWQDDNTGIIVQWGLYTIGNGDSDSWVSGGNYPKAFPNNCFIVNGSLAGDGGASTDNFMAVRKDATTPLVNFEYYTNNLPGTNRVAFIAIGN